MPVDTGTQGAPELLEGVAVAKIDRDDPGPLANASVASFPRGPGLPAYQAKVRGLLAPSFDACSLAPSAVGFAAVLRTGR